MDQRAKDRQEELEWLDHCLRIIRSNIIRYEREFELKHAQVQELFRSIQGGNEELYSQMMTAASLEEHAKIPCAKTGPRWRSRISAASIIRT